AVDRPADDRRGPDTDQLGEAKIAVEDVPGPRQRHRALLHLLDEHPVGLLGALEREELRAVRAIDDEGVDLALPNGAQRLLRFLQLSLQLPDQLAIRRVVRHVLCRHLFYTRSSPCNTLVLFDIYSMSRRVGISNSI